MKTTFIGLLALVLHSAIAAPMTGPGFATHSASGQFVVQSGRAPAVAPAQSATVPREFIELNPTLLAVSADRVRQALTDEIGLPTRWHDKIYLTLEPAAASDGRVTIVSERFQDGWVYRLTLPDVIQRRQLVRALVNAILLEHCNLNARDHTVEIPAWLSEGLTQHLLATRESKLMLPPPKLSAHGLTFQTVDAKAQKSDPLAAARQCLRAHRPLTLEQLSWPTDAQLLGDDESVYYFSSQLFVKELVSFKDAKRCFAELLDQLPQFYNWQTAFLRAFQPHFQTTLDLDKWWTLQLVHFCGHDPGEVWTANESYDKLDEILHASAAVRKSARELPERQLTSLQTVLREWSPTQQKNTLLEKLRELELARFRVAPQLTPLVDEYHAVLRGYLDRLESTTLSLTVNKSAFLPAGSIARDYAARLDALDARRKAMRAELAAGEPAGLPRNPGIPQ